MDCDTCYQCEPLCPSLGVAGDTWEFHQPHFKTHSLGCTSMCPLHDRNLSRSSAHNPAQPFEQQDLQSCS